MEQKSDIERVTKLSLEVQNWFLGKARYIRLTGQEIVECAKLIEDGMRLLQGKELE